MAIIAAQALAEQLGGTLRHCPPDRPIARVQPLDEAGPDAVSFLANPKYGLKAKASQAGVILVSPKVDLGELPVIVVPNPYWGFAQALSILHPEPEPEWSSEPIHPTATLGPGCRIAPGSTVGARSVLGARCVIHPGVHIAEDCVVGDDCTFHPGVVLYRRTRVGHRVLIHANSVLGSDGFGFVEVDGQNRKVPQVGWVEVEDDVELGACTTVDRGAMGPTRLGRGTKVDNLVQVAHNVRTGANCTLCGQTALAGSTTLGDNVIFAGRAGSTGHLHVGTRAIVSSCCVVAKDVPEGAMFSGFPGRPHKEWLVAQAALMKVPDLLKKR